MENVTFIEIGTLSGLESHAIITHADGSYTSMPKATYEAQVKQLTSPLIDSTT